MATLAELDNITKLKYLTNKNGVFDAAMKRHPLLDMIMKKGNAGATTKVPVDFSFTSFRSTDPTVAYGTSIAANQTGKAWEVTPFSNYAAGRLTGEAADLLQGDAAILSSVTYELNKAVYGLTDDLAKRIYRTSTGELAQSAADVSNLTGSTGAVRESGSIDLFYPGMVLQRVDTVGGTLRNGGATNTVSRVDPATNSLVFEQSMSGAWGNDISVNDYYVVAGDNNNTMHGLLDWLAPNGVNSNLFEGVDRSTAPGKLSGLVEAGSITAPSGSIKTLARRIMGNGGHADIGFVHPLVFDALENQNADKKRFVDGQDTLSIGFANIVMNGPSGKMTIYADPYCPYGYAFLLSSKELYLLHGGAKPVNVVNRDGKIWRAKDANDVWEARVASRAAIVAPAPGRHGVVTLT